MNEHIFRAYDIRGLVGADLNAETVTILARAIGVYFKQNDVRFVTLGYDARESSPVFRDLFIDELNKLGMNVLDAGMIPTPLLYFTLFTAGADAGVMITGSHNPAEYNGFKISVGKNSLHGKQIQEIKEIAQSLPAPSTPGDFSGAISVSAMSVLSDYSDYVAGNIRLGARKLKVVVDAGNGIGGTIAVPVYRRLGCEVIELHTKPDGRFPNHHPDPTVLENMRDAIRAVEDNKADLAIVYDGDADRIGAVDETGRVLWGDELTMIFARSILEKTPGATIVADVKCSQHLFDDIEKRGGNAVMCKSGHSIIKAKMCETDAILAGEMSGHIFFADRYFGFDDAIYAGARILEILSNSNKSLSEFLAELPPAINTPEIRIDCSEERKFEVVQRISQEFRQTNTVIEIDGARIIFADGWGLVRASNTQAILVLRFEANSVESLENIQKNVVRRVQELIEQK